MSNPEIHIATKEGKIVETNSKYSKFTKQGSTQGANPLQKIIDAEKAKKKK